jgi:hypothetical protein
MARKLATNSQIDAFISAVITQAQHHAPQVVNVIQPLANAVRARLNLARDTVHVYERNGHLARTCWVKRAGRRYAFSYNYDQGVIDLRRGGIQGPTIFQFSNSTTARQIKRQARRL